jgi:ABC-type phosphate transport system substrate-binding protein
VNRRLAVALLVPGFLLRGAVPAASAEARSWVVIVNRANPTDEVQHDDLARLFLKKMRKWPDGKIVQPVDLSLSSAIRSQFAMDALGMQLGVVRDYWMKQTLSGADVPPFVKNSEADVLEYVKSEAGAVGYVSATLQLPAEVKVVKVK